MVSDRGRLLRRALDDLNEGIRSLLGPAGSRPGLVRELLDGERRQAPSPAERPRRRGPGRRRAASKPRLVRVE